ncbi:hypothetical protein Kpol_489p16 [Vanderwaltozyma polyspora DSM 70294]|uniref:GST N-terminal domain-containing protein n=1 Tax=Vanderwaltozyma polyspora (strain ATCC 22028 / DSM 70294 / BCRC 21397 / CBS 2163 / NBRC 10782 / NRRL Y-8283 / UCD 57-17) TaxID=436907 RepID=A7TQ30_VANPO|nr:uncharacterized protein Kpol_489p16 [Vanderwaltozyma polyspora DSM 70294]EDO15635.1 hypothetical protein Kpol_489p16 [Vanderwaltozyma polyspora DSM 70294]
MNLIKNSKLYKYFYEAPEEDTAKSGQFIDRTTHFREIISPSHPIYKPEEGRYWLYASLACPWAHRTLITRALKGLNKVIGVSIVHWYMDERGWKFIPVNPDFPMDPDDSFRIDGGVKTTGNDISTPTGDISNNRNLLNVDGTYDRNYDFESLSELYLLSDPSYNGKYTVPVLWDLKTKTIVNNESADIIRILNSGVFNEFIDFDTECLHHKIIDVYPKPLRQEIDKFNEWVLEYINEGVYKVGFAEDQEEYEKHVKNLFEHLDKVEDLLEKKYDLLSQVHNDQQSILKEFYTVGSQLTEADIRLYTTMVRFDPVYVQHFKCNLRTIRDGYPFIDLWLRNLYWNHGEFRNTTNFNHLKLSYTRGQPSINPLGITALGPMPDIPQIQ